MPHVQSVMSDAFSRVVKRRREEKGLSRAALAEMAGLHQTYIGLLEREERSPNLDTAKAIASALGLTLTQMVAEAERLSKRK
ncbi:MAG: helix-turn-helix transcriptional regulator [Limisphaerales bacterium]